MRLLWESVPGDVELIDRVEVKPEFVVVVVEPFVLRVVQGRVSFKYRDDTGLVVVRKRLGERFRFLRTERRVEFPKSIVRVR